MGCIGPEIVNLHLTIRSEPTRLLRTPISPQFTMLFFRNRNSWTRGNGPCRSVVFFLAVLERNRRQVERLRRYLGKFATTQLFVETMTKNCDRPWKMRTNLVKNCDHWKTKKLTWSRIAIPGKWINCLDQELRPIEKQHNLARKMRKRLLTFAGPALATKNPLPSGVPCDASLDPWCLDPWLAPSWLDPWLSRDRCSKTDRQRIAFWNFV